MKHFVLFFTALCFFMAGAQNPIINSAYTADPTARVFEGKVYLYPSHDIQSPVERLDEWFCMADYHAYSSDNLVDWTDHGVIVTQNEVPWVQPDSYSMWAPDCVEKDGIYYFYFPSVPKADGPEMRRGFGVGVATSASPAGPFVPQARPIEGIMGIDPCVLIDPKDGKPYIFWSGMGLRVAPLADNMLQLAGEPVAIAGLPDGFKEGPFAFEREGKYYLTFPWVRQEGGTETLAYAMADAPMGPYEFQGLIMAESPTGCWTNHHSIVEYNGKWYLFYHHNDYSPTHDKRRSARIDELTFNPDGTIQLVEPTLRGVGVSDATKAVQIDRYSRISDKGATIDYIHYDYPWAGWATTLAGKDGWVEYDNVDFGSGDLSAVVAKVKSAKGGTIAIDVDGQTVAVIEVGEQDEWRPKEAALTAKVQGIGNLKVKKLKGDDVMIDYVKFK